MKTSLCLPLLVLAAFAPAAQAERADRDKPIQLEAQRVTVDDAKKIQILEGDVVLIKGTLIIQSDKVVVTEDQYGFQRGTAFGGKGGLARFRQKREGKEEYIEGEAERIEYDGRADKVELFNRAYVKSGLDEVRGQYIAYDGKTENYVATSGTPDGDKAGRNERVRAVIQPKNKDGGKPAGQ